MTETGKGAVGQTQPSQSVDKKEDKGTYEVMQDKTIVDGVMYMKGEAIELTRDQVEAHRERGVSYRGGEDGGPLKPEEAKKLQKHDGKTMAQREHERAQAEDKKRSEDGDRPRDTLFGGGRNQDNAQKQGTAGGGALFGNRRNQGAAPRDPERITEHEAGTARNHPQAAQPRGPVSANTEPDPDEPDRA